MHATPPAPHRTTTPRNVAIALIWAVGLGLLLVALILWIQSDDTGSANATAFGSASSPDSFARAPLAEAKNECTAGQLADENTTLIIDVQGTDLDSGSTSVDDLACVLTELDTPTYVISQMDSTRALDGMQSASWETYTAQWTYHPDQGLDVTIHQES